MITQLLKRSVVADKTVARICQIICSIVGGLVLAQGIRRLATLDLDEAQLYTALTGTLFLSGVFIVLAFLCRAWQRAA
jgi:hypothetical protein